MAWNQPGKGSQDPWRGKGAGGGMDAWTQRLRGLFGGPSGGVGPLAIVAAVVVLALLFNTFKLIDAQEKGVVLRFGAFNRVIEPGANLKWPWPIETVTVIQTESSQLLEDQVKVLTKDENIVDIHFNVQYAVMDPRAYLYAFRDDTSQDGTRPQGRETLQNAAESAVREVVGNNTMDTVLFERAGLTDAARKHLQETLDQYHTGLRVRTFSLQDARPPEEVREAFDDAISAREDKNRSESEARAYASKIVPEARGDAARITAGALGYRDATIAKAQGDARRFEQLVVQYRKAPEVTRKRLYLETMQQVLAQNRKVIAGRDNNVLYLPMDGAAPADPAKAIIPTLPTVKATATAEPDRPEREPRGNGREGNR